MRPRGRLRGFAEALNRHGGRIIYIGALVLGAALVVRGLVGLLG